MPSFAVFSADAQAGRVETYEAPTAGEAAAMAIAAHPGAEVSAIPAERLEGCNRTELLMAWMDTLA